MVVFAIHGYESATGIHVPPGPKRPSHLPPHPIPLGCRSALALSALFHALNSDWSSISQYGHIYEFWGPRRVRSQTFEAQFNR